MTHAIVTKLRNLAVAAETHADAEIVALKPKLEALAHDVENTLEAWHSSTDEWIETHFIPEAEKAKDAARRMYEAALKQAHDFYETVKTKV